MANVSTETLVRAIHDSETWLVVAVTGGGSGAIAELLGVPGASHSILEAVIPYSPEALANWLGAAPEQACSPRTARAMATVAMERARRYAPLAERWAGVSCTASLATDRPKKGEHRVHVAVQTPSTTINVTLELAKGRRSRAEEEQIATSVVLNFVAEACGLNDRLELHLLPGEHLDVSRFTAPKAWQQLWSGVAPLVRLNSPESDIPTAVFPGAFNPLHLGHRRMAQIAASMLKRRVAYEISILNVDKPPLDYFEVNRRLEQFTPDEPVWLSRAPTFVEKSIVFPGATFIAGVDTIARIADEHYYGGNVAARQAAIERLVAAGCKFLVFGRKFDGEFQTLSELSLPEPLRSICQEVPAATFQEDISSTELRKLGRW